MKFTEKPRTLPGLIINLEHHLGRSYSEKTSVRSRFLNSNRIPALKEPTPTALPGAAPAGASTRRTACHLRRVQGCCQQWQDVTAFFRRCLHSGTYCTEFKIFLLCFFMQLRFCSQKKMQKNNLFFNNSQLKTSYKPEKPPLNWKCPP